MKQPLLALVAMAAVTAMSIAAADAKTNSRPASNIDDDYYDSGCHTVISHHYAPQRGEEVTEESRTCS